MAARRLVWIASGWEEIRSSGKTTAYKCPFDSAADAPGPPNVANRVVGLAMLESDIRVRDNARKVLIPLDRMKDGLNEPLLKHTKTYPNIPNRPNETKTNMEN